MELQGITRLFGSSIALAISVQLCVSEVWEETKADPPTVAAPRGCAGLWVQGFGLSKRALQETRAPVSVHHHHHYGSLPLCHSAVTPVCLYIPIRFEKVSVCPIGS